MHDRPKLKVEKLEVTDYFMIREQRVRFSMSFMNRLKFLIYGYDCDFVVEESLLIPIPKKKRSGLC